MKKLYIVLSMLVLSFVACKKESEQPFIHEKTKEKVIQELIKKYGDSARIRVGVDQVAQFWRKEDGTEEDFAQFCLTHFVTGKELDTLFQRLNYYLENMWGYYNALTIENNRYVHEPRGEITFIDEMFAGYNVASHFNEDMFTSKIAFVFLLNFPHKTLEEKNKLGIAWNAKAWGFARMGDVFTTRLPADLQMKASKSLSESENYISSYNIYLGKVQTSDRKFLFPKDKILISHWGLRDEIKANYTDTILGLRKQQLIYQIMLHIINQTIPQKVINDSTYVWQPEKNILIENGKVLQSASEPNTRYEKLLNNFKTQKALDPYYPYYPTTIARKFDMEMEMSADEVEKLFDQYLSNPLMQRIASYIEKKLKRPLQPFDIWFNRFSDKATLDEASLDAITKKRYPNNKAFEQDIPRILTSLGFSKDEADFIASKIVVDPARGSGHAWGAQMKRDVSHLRTRIPADGMLYKGYNIAIHELGHNVEQTISLHYVPYYILSGVPNTAFTEALAFLFQHRDLEILGIKQSSSNDADVLQLAWSIFEIMGVSLVDIQTWKWLYEHPNATPEQLKNAVVTIANNVWNTYYAPIFKVKDQPILAIYSHMINDPLYLSAYPIGHIIQFQLENYIKDKSFAQEVKRIFAQGKLTPDVWMLKATGEKISIVPLLRAVETALNNLEKN